MRTRHSLVATCCTALLLGGCGGTKQTRPTGGQAEQSASTVETLHRTHRVTAREMTHAVDVFSRLVRECRQIRAAVHRRRPLARLLRRADADGLAVLDLATRTRRPPRLIALARRAVAREPRCTATGALRVLVASG